MKKELVRIIERFPSFAKTNVEFVLRNPLFDAIEVQGKISFSRPSRTSSLLEQMTTFQSILSDYE